jgi:predicted nucleotidyltransferase
MTSQTGISLERQQRADEIVAQLKDKAAEVLAQYPVAVAYLHGSVARGRPLPSSDVDIALLLTEMPAPYPRLQLELSIQFALEDACHLTNLDVRSINHAPIMVQGPIVQEGVLLYERDREQRIAFEVLTRKKYFDFRPVAEKLQKAFLDRLQREGFRRGKPKYHHRYPK